MHVVWKRPDGFFGASPEDFQIFRVADGCGLWLHRTDKETYPFRIAGGWQETKATQRLNRLVNLLQAEDEAVIDYLKESYDQSMSEDANGFWSEIDAWLNELSKHIKGDQWEIELVSLVLQTLIDRHHSIKVGFVTSAKDQ